MKRSFIIGILFWTIILFVVFLVALQTSNQLAQADSDTADTLTVIGNATPTLGSLTPNAPSLQENGNTASATITAVVTDNNGYGEISAITAVFYDKGASQDNTCSANAQKCYTGITCTTSSCASLQCDVSCSVSLWHYTNASSQWEWYIQAFDGTATGTATSSAVTIDALTALDVTEASINYGTLSLGATSTEKSVTVSNTGNKNGLNTGIKESVAFACTVGSITSNASQGQHYSTTTSFAYSDGTVLATTTTTLATAIAQGSDGTHAPSSLIYWLLVVPGSNVSGSCTGTDYFEAQ